MNLEQILEQVEMIDIADININPLFQKMYDETFEVFKDYEKVSILEKKKETELLKESMMHLDDKDMLQNNAEQIQKRNTQRKERLFEKKIKQMILN